MQGKITPEMIIYLIFGFLTLSILLYASNFV